MRESIHSTSGFGRILAATGHSFRGLSTAWRSEAAFRQESIIAAIMVPAAFWLGQTTIEQLLLFGSVMLVLIVELLNSAVEYTVDRISTDHHELSGGAKDIGSAAVFLSLLNAGIVWVFFVYARFA